ncbi:MAG: hypothetical protein RLZZ195_279 [Pseudomonadota bacterium]|jgi:hypothetical protein
MFNKDIFEKIGEEIYVYKNFLSKEFCEDLVNSIKKIEDKDWDLIGESGRYFSKPGTVNFEPIYENIISSINLEDGFNIQHGSRALKMIKDSFMSPHADNVEYDSLEKQALEYVEGEPYDLRENTHYGMVIYLNDFEGGELEYVNQNIIYKPNVGDFVIHSAKENCTHGVKKVLSDVRYSYSNNIFNFVKIKSGYISYPGLGKSNYVSETEPKNVLNKETWFKPSTGQCFIFENGNWKEILR